MRPPDSYSAIDLPNLLTQDDPLPKLQHSFNTLMTAREIFRDL